MGMENRWTVTAMGAGTGVVPGGGCGRRLWNGWQKGRLHRSAVVTAVSAPTVAMGSKPRDRLIGLGDDESLLWQMIKEREEDPRLASGGFSWKVLLECLRVAMNMSNSSSTSDVELSSFTGSDSAKEGVVAAVERVSSEA